MAKMQNVKMSVEADKKGKEKLVIEVDLSAKPTPSASGKTMVVASTRGNEEIGGEGEPGHGVFIGLNVYTYPEEK